MYATLIIIGLSNVHAMSQCEGTKKFYQDITCCGDTGHVAMCTAQTFDTGSLVPGGLQHRIFVTTDSSMAFYFVSDIVMLRRSPKPNAVLPTTKAEWLSDDHARSDFLYPFDKHARYGDHHVLWGSRNHLVTLHNETGINGLGWALTSVGKNSITIHGPRGNDGGMSGTSGGQWFTFSPTDVTFSELP